MRAGVVLDVDDTMYLERDYVRSGFDAVDRWCRTDLSVEGVGATAWQLFCGGTRRTTLTDALASHGVPVTPELRAGVVAAYREHRPRIGLAPDARRFLDRVSAQHLVAVVTDGPASSQRAKCTALGLDLVADPLVVTAELGTSKPDPACFLAVSEAWGLSGDRLVYVADNPLKDFLAPEALGWHTVRVRRPGSLHVEVATPRGVPEVRDLDAVVLPWDSVAAAATRRDGG